MKITKSGIKGVKAHSSVTVITPCNLYGCELSPKVFIGPFVEIQKGVKIGERTKVQSHSFICELVEIGNDCFIGHGVVFINDLFSDGGPASGDTSKWKSTHIGSNVSIGSNSTILPVSVCDNVVIGAGSVVTKDVNSPGIYAGNPAKKLRAL
ncbi:MAG: N-acetyltransferase [Ekhidna sp.]|nr:N-acetyltransferase [Ekhidna sp.]